MALVILSLLALSNTSLVSPQIGAFGGITPFGSQLKNRKEMWDVAAAGPLAGGLASLALVVIGLSQSGSGAADAAMLVPVPASLFQVRRGAHRASDQIKATALKMGSFDAASHNTVTLQIISNQAFCDS